jgi:hypothetical protein
MVQVTLLRSGPLEPECRVPTNLSSPEKTAVTPEETQAEIKSLREQVLQLRIHNEAAN